MTRDITVQELQEHFADHMEEVRRGVTLRLIDGGNPVARILPDETKPGEAKTSEWYVVRADGEHVAARAVQRVGRAVDIARPAAPARADDAEAGGQRVAQHHGTRAGAPARVRDR